MDVQKTIEFILEQLAASAARQTTHDMQIGKLIELQQRNETLMADMLESINSLARIAHAHEQRISRLEEGRA